MDLLKWNMADNRQWWLRIDDSGGDVTARLYLSQAEAEAFGTAFASYTTDTYGDALEVVLTTTDGSALEMLQPEYGWHMVISGQAEDPTLILRVGPFVELDEISNAIYRDSRLIERRATAEIDAHTHANIARQVSLGIHLPDLEPGDTAQISSTRRGIDAIGQVAGHRIAGDTNSLTSELDISFYMELTR